MDDKRKNKISIKRIALATICIMIASFVCFIIYQYATRNNEYYISEKNIQIPVFVYHDIVKDESEIEYDYMQTTYDTFKNQIDGLMKMGYKPISYDELMKYSKGEIKLSKWSFVITFDDGYTGVYDYAYEYAKEKNIPITSFINNVNVGKPGYYSWEQAKEMNDSGVVGVYSHGYEHIEYDKVDAERLLNDTNKAYDELKAKMDDADLLKVFTYPYGLYTSEELETLKEAGYMQNLTDNKINKSNTLNIYGLHRCYPLSDSPFKIWIKIQYRAFRYKS